MCGIFGIFNMKGDYTKNRKKFINHLKRLLPRGPDATSIQHYNIDKNVQNFIGHTRLSIVDPYHGDQPFFGTSKNSCSITNGEIYNHKELRKNLEKEHKFSGNSDCEIIVHLYDEVPDMIKLCNLLLGKFGSIIYDVDENRVFAIRDHIGIVPVYIGHGPDGELYVASELKAFYDIATSIEILMPGHYYDSKLNKQIKWYNPAHLNMELIPTTPVDLSQIRNLLIQAVKRRLMCDAPFGVLLSGGLDSSLIASITSRIYGEHVQEHSNDLINIKKLTSFCVGLEGSPDLKASREVAKFLGTRHHEFTFTIQEGLDAVPDVIYALETFNPTTIRAATGMFLMARKIKTLGIKMVLTGEGADEMFGGYLYFNYAPNKEEFHKETLRKISNLYKFDLLRADKSTMAWGVETRVPYMDKDFISYVMSFDPESKMINKGTRNIEKWVLRKAFDVEEGEKAWLPDSILWRQKEQFSDGVGYNWVDSLKETAEKTISDEDFKIAANRFPLKTPETKEAYYYRAIFEELFKSSMPTVNTVPFNKSIACSTEEVMHWHPSFSKNADESGRAVLGHVASNSK